MKLLICGKGGCGKSTVAALLAAAMNKRGKNVLLVDADESNIGLYRMMGLDMPESLMESLGGKKGFRNKTAPPAAMPVGMPVSMKDSSSQLFPEGLKADGLPENCVASSDGIRMMSVGKILHYGEGCACPMGKLFRLLFSSLRIDQNELVIVDTAAGVEHFGRNLDGQCDRILCVADPSYESIMMVKRVSAFAGEANLPVSVILNRLTPEVSEELDAALENVTAAGRLPFSQSIFINNFKGNPLDMEMPEIESVCDMLEKNWQ